MSEFQPSQYTRRESDQNPPIESWHLDKKVPIALIFAMLTQFAAVIWFFADIKRDVELLKADAVVLHQRDVQNSDGLKDALKQMQDLYQRLDSKLDRLIERGQK
jgi:hypothetical protein